MEGGKKCRWWTAVYSALSSWRNAEYICLRQKYYRILLIMYCSNLSNALFIFILKGNMKKLLNTIVKLWSWSLKMLPRIPQLDTYIVWWETLKVQLIIFIQYVYILFSIHLFVQAKMCSKESQLQSIGYQNVQDCHHSLTCFPSSPINIILTFHLYSTCCLVHLSCLVGGMNSHCRIFLNDPGLWQIMWTILPNILIPLPCMLIDTILTTKGNHLENFNLLKIVEKLDLFVCLSF